MEKLCEALGYSFRNRELLVTALTHPSYGGCLLYTSDAADD